MEISTSDTTKSNPTRSMVAVLCYTMDDNNVLHEIGVSKEANDQTESGFSENIILGSVEHDDTSLLFRAMQSLEETAGIEIKDPSRWNYLEDLHFSKLSSDKIFVFAVNVTGITSFNKDFSMKTVQEALATGDAVLVSSFFRLFMKIYSKDFKQNS